MTIHAHAPRFIFLWCKQSTNNTLAKTFLDKVFLSKILQLDYVTPHVPLDSSSFDVGYSVMQVIHLAPENISWNFSIRIRIFLGIVVLVSIDLPTKTNTKLEFVISNSNFPKFSRLVLSPIPVDVPEALLGTNAIFYSPYIKLYLLTNALCNNDDQTANVALAIGDTHPCQPHCIEPHPCILVW